MSELKKFWEEQWAKQFNYNRQDFLVIRKFSNDELRDNILDSVPKEDFCKAEDICLLFGIELNLHLLTEKEKEYLYLLDMAYYYLFEEQIMGLKYIKTENGVKIDLEKHPFKFVSDKKEKQHNFDEREVYLLTMLWNGTEYESVEDNIAWEVAEIGQVINYESIFHREGD